MVVVGGSMSKVRVYEVAKQLNLDPKAVVGLFQSIGVTDVRFELFDATHGGISWRYPLSLAFLAERLSVPVTN